MTSMAYWPSSFDCLVFCSSSRLPAIFPSSENTLTWNRDTHDEHFQSGSVQIPWKLKCAKRGTLWHFQTTAYQREPFDGIIQISFFSFSKPMNPHDILIMVTRGNHTAGFMWVGFYLIADELLKVDEEALAFWGHDQDGEMRV